MKSCVVLLLIAKLKTGLSSTYLLNVNNRCPFHCQSHVHTAHLTFMQTLALMDASGAAHGSVSFSSGLDDVPNGRRAVLLPHFKGLRLNWAVLYFLIIWWIFNIKSEQNRVSDRPSPSN